MIKNSCLSITDLTLWLPFRGWNFYSALCIFFHDGLSFWVQLYVNTQFGTFYHMYKYLTPNLDCERNDDKACSSLATCQHSSKSLFGCRCWEVLNDILICWVICYCNRDSLFFSVHTMIYKQPSIYKQAMTPGTWILLVREEIKSEIGSVDVLIISSQVIPINVCLCLSLCSLFPSPCSVSLDFFYIQWLHMHIEWIYTTISSFTALLSEVEYYLSGMRRKGCYPYTGDSALMSRLMKSYSYLCTWQG